MRVSGRVRNNAHLTWVILDQGFGAFLRSIGRYLGDDLIDERAPAFRPQGMALGTLSTFQAAARVLENWQQCGERDNWGSLNYPLEDLLLEGSSNL